MSDSASSSVSVLSDARPAFSCLVLEDDPSFSAMVSHVVMAEGGAPTVCGSLAAAEVEIGRQSFDLALLDNRLPDGTGYEFHARLSRRLPANVAIMITGAPELSQAIELTRNGLFDYLTKPIDIDALSACLRRAKERLCRPDPDPGAPQLVGESSAVRELSQLLRQAAQHPEATVLLLGETGTGKDLAARLLHRLTFPGHDPLPPYVAFNCSAVPSEMFEAELFGSERGAYTGAHQRRKGLAEAAEGGTLFLDEVADIPLTLQPKLLRFLEAREFRLLGTTAPRPFTGRVVAASNRSLKEEVERGRFREDLMYRLDVLQVRVPSLRERLTDLGPLSEHLLNELSAKYRRKKPLIRPVDLQLLQGYRFPGNVRELRNILERSLLRTSDASAWLAMDLGWLRDSIPPGSPPPPSSVATSTAPNRTLNPIELQEYQLIQKVLREEGGGIRRAAARLGLTHQALLRRLQKWPELRQTPPPATTGPS